MLLYNNKQEFIGIDDEGLQLLNYSSLEELLSVCTDVADLFANEPGYIHNFKNFGWIDFLLHADSDASSAIVHANGRTFSCRLSVSNFYLCAAPGQNGYRIDILQVKNISGEEFKAHVITPKAATEPFVPPVAPVAPIVATAPLPDYTHLTPTQLNEPSVLDVPTTPSTSFDHILEEEDDKYASLLAPLSEKELDLVPAEVPAAAIAVPQPIPTPEAPAIKTPVPVDEYYSAEEQEYLSHHKVQDSYVFDPSVAANELGLPVDLIEEFIGDFIQQSYEFKNELFASASKNDINTLHILSHKLKGVAANLRVENALEALTIINSATDAGEIAANLKYYFNIIAKLEGKEVQATEAPVQKEPVKQSAPIALDDMDDIYSFSLKQDETETLLVHHDDVQLEEAPSAQVATEPVFEKEYFSMEDETPEPAATIKEEPLPADTENGEESISVPLHYDRNSVAGALGIEPVFMEELLHDYKIDALEMSTAIIGAIKAFDSHTWKSSAAKLKGISDNLRLSEISDELAVLSTTNDAQEAKKASARLINYLDQL